MTFSSLYVYNNIDLLLCMIIWESIKFPHVEAYLHLNPNH